MIPKKMTHFHGADRDTGAATTFEVVNPAYVEALEQAIKAANEALHSGEGVGLIYYLEFGPANEEDLKHMELLKQVLGERSQ